MSVANGATGGAANDAGLLQVQEQQGSSGAVKPSATAAAGGAENGGKDGDAASPGTAGRSSLSSEVSPSPDAIPAIDWMLGQMKRSLGQQKKETGAASSVVAEHGDETPAAAGSGSAGSGSAWLPVPRSLRSAPPPEVVNAAAKLLAGTGTLLDQLNGVVESIAVVPGAAAADAAGWVGIGGGGSNSTGGGGKGAGRGAAGGEGGGRGGRGRGGRQSGRREGRGGAGSAGDPSAAQGATGGGIGSGNSSVCGSGSGSGSGGMGYSGRKDALVLTFREAKVSVVEFDDAVQRLKVRCSAVLVYRCHLHFLTRKQPGHTQTGHNHPGNTETGPDAALISPTTQRSASFKGGLDRSSSFRGGSAGEAPRFGGSFTIDLRPLGISNPSFPMPPSIKVRDFVFLSEPGDPIVAVLWEEGSAWAGRLGGSSPAVLEARFSCAVTFLRVSLHTRSHLILGTTKHLPFNSCSLFPAPFPKTSSPLPSRSLLLPSRSPRSPPLPPPHSTVLAASPLGRLRALPAPLPPLEWSRLVLPPHSLHFRSLRILKNEPSLPTLPAPPYLQHLPFDSYALSPAPFPPGGLLVLSPHSLHFCSSSSTCHLALNDSSPPALPDGTEIPRPRQQPGQVPLSVELEAAHATWQPVIGPSGGPVGVGGSSSSAVAFLASKGGALVVVKVTPEANSTLSPFPPSHPFLPLTLSSLSPFPPSHPFLPLTLSTLSPFPPSLPFLPLTLSSLSPFPPSHPFLPLTLSTLSPFPPSLPFLPLTLSSLSPFPPSHPFLPLTLSSLSPFPPSHPFHPLTLSSLSPLPPSHPFHPLTLSSLSPFPPSHPFHPLTLSSLSPFPPSHPFLPLTLSSLSPFPPSHPFLPLTLSTLSPFPPSHPFHPLTLSSLSPFPPSHPFHPLTLSSLSPFPPSHPFHPLTLSTLSPFPPSHPFLPLTLSTLSPFPPSHPFHPLTLSSLSPFPPSHPFLPLTLSTLSPFPPSLPFLPLTLSTLSPFPPSHPFLPLTLSSLSPFPPSHPFHPLTLSSLSPFPPSHPFHPLTLSSLSPFPPSHPFHPLTLSSLSPFPPSHPFHPLTLSSLSPFPLSHPFHPLTLSTLSPFPPSHPFLPLTLSTLSPFPPSPFPPSHPFLPLTLSSLSPFPPSHPFLPLTLSSLSPFPPSHPFLPLTLSTLSPFPPSHPFLPLTLSTLSPFPPSHPFLPLTLSTLSPFPPSHPFLPLTVSSLSPFPPSHPFHPLTLSTLSPFPPSYPFHPLTLSTLSPFPPSHPFLPLTLSTLSPFPPSHPFLPLTLSTLSPTPPQPNLMPQGAYIPLGPAAGSGHHAGRQLSVIIRLSISFPSASTVRISLRLPLSSPLFPLLFASTPPPPSFPTFHPSYLCPRVFIPGEAARRGAKHLKADETSDGEGTAAAVPAAPADAAAGAEEEQGQEGFSFRVCDSLLNIGPIRDLVPEKQRGAKRLKADEASDGEAGAAADVAGGAEEEEEEEEQGQEGFSFRVCDSLLNIGPIRDLVPVPAFPTPTSQQQQQQQQEVGKLQMLVACSGHGKNGALSVLLQRVPLDVLTQVRPAHSPEGTATATAAAASDAGGVQWAWEEWRSVGAAAASATGRANTAREGGEDGQAAAGGAGGTAVEGEGAGKGGIGGVEGGEQGCGAGAMEVEGGSGVGGGKGARNSELLREVSAEVGSITDIPTLLAANFFPLPAPFVPHPSLPPSLLPPSFPQVLETGELLREVSAEVSFITDAPTLLAANLFSRRCILQVTPSAVRLLASSASLLQEMLPRGMVVERGQEGWEGMEEGKEGEEDVEIESADVADPYVMLRLVDGRFILLGPDPSKPLSLVPIPCHLPSPSSDPITAYSLLLSPSPAISNSHSSTTTTSGTSTSSALACALGSSGGSSGGNSSGKGTPSFTAAPPSPPVPLCAVARRSGLLQLYLLPSLRCVFSSLGLADSHTLLKHTPAAAAAAAAVVAAATDAAEAGRGGKDSLPVGGEATDAGTAAATAAPAAAVTATATAGSEAMEVDIKPGDAEKKAVGKQESGKVGVGGDEEMVVKEERRDGEGKEEGKKEAKEGDVEMDGGSGAGNGVGKGTNVKAEEKGVKTEVKETEGSQKIENDGAVAAVTAHTPAPVATSAHMSAPDWPKQFVVDLHVSVNPVTGRLFLFVVLSDGRLLGFRAFCPSGASPGDVIAASVTVTGERGVKVGGRAGGGGGHGVGEGEPGGRAGSIGVGGFGVGGLRFKRVCLEEEEAGIHEVEGEEEGEEEGKGEGAVGRGAGPSGGAGGEGRMKQEGGGEKGGGESGGGESGGGDPAAEEKAQGEEGAERSRRAGRARKKMLFPYQGVGLEGSGGGGGGGGFGGRGKGGVGDSGGIGGVFVAGSRPRWLMLLRDRVWVHPVAAEAASSVVAMAPFHNVNCTHGFLLISSLGVLSICQLPPLFQFDNAWPLNKVSRPVSQFLVPSLEDPKDPTTAALGLAGPGGPGAPGSSGTDAEAVAMVEDFQLRVVTCPSLEAPSRALEVRQRFEFQPFEAVTMVKSVVLRNRSSGQLQTLLAVCTTFITGEDAPGKGRILLFEYNPLATADGDGPAAAGTGAAATADAEGKAAGGSNGIPLLRELYSKEPIAGSSQRGSVAALTALQGNLLLAVGRQLVLYAWNGVELEGIAFLDAPLYVVSMATVKSFVIVGDVLKSVYFLHWREEGAQLTLLARDFFSLPITAVDFLIDGSALGLLATDTAKNLQVFAYSKSIETHMGQKLLLKASFHTGEVLSKVLRLPLPPPLATAAGGRRGGAGGGGAAASGRTNRFGVLAGTLGGAIVVVTPVPELVFRRLDTVQRYMVTAVEQTAGLHPLAFRAVQGLGKGQQHSGVERMIDSQLLAQYALMEDSQQQQLAEDVGSTRPMVLQNLRDLAHNAMLF
ncbi:unnamed protein product [Closterium sp. NIES-65]|nr:unnamed protein product [Closterium sp. NIES-65]